MSSDPQDRPKLDLLPTPPQPLELPLDNGGDRNVPAAENVSTDNSANDILPVAFEAIAPEESAPVSQPETTSESENPTPIKLKPVATVIDPEVQALQVDLDDLRAEKSALIAEIATLKQQKQELFDAQTGDLQAQIQQLMTLSLQTLEEKQSALQKSVEQLERRRDRIREEMRTTFAGTSQEIAVRVQGFRDYLMGSLQDLVMAAEQLDFPTYEEKWTQAAPPKPEAVAPKPEKMEAPQFSKQSFATKVRRIEETLDQYRMAPNYYGAPWQLRRTFEPIHAERVKRWFFEQGGRGAVRSMGSRLQNILVASASLSVLHSMYGDRLRALILANTPERLGEWRRGLQDCLGISRSDFGPNSGVILFENPDALVQKADRLVEDDRLPLIIIDEAEDNISLSLLQYSLWLAFAPEPKSDSSYFF
jgi:hypothetical protein